MASSRKFIVRTTALGTLVVAVLVTFVPGTPMGSVWTHGSPLPGLVEAPGPFSEMAFRSNQMPLAIAAIVAVVGITLLVISTRLEEPSTARDRLEREGHVPERTASGPR